MRGVLRIGSALSLLLGVGTGVPSATAATCVASPGPTYGETSEIQFTTSAAQDLCAKASELGSPVKIYEFVRNNYAYTLYHGSRSGSINTFLGGKGNDVDLASTLIAMYRSQGIPAVYVVGQVRVAAGDAMNWLGVTDLDLAIEIMNQQGIQGVAL